MRLTLVISSLGSGGAERVMSVMANHWAERGREVTILTLDGGEAPFYPLHPAVKHTSLRFAPKYRNLLAGFFRNVHRMRLLRAHIRESQPQVVIGFIDKVNVLTILATRGLKVPVIVSERVDPSSYGIGLIWRTLRQLTYPLADALVCQNPVIASQFRRLVGEKAAVIANPVAPACSPTKAEIPEGGNRLMVAMGRLVEQKGFDLLLRAFEEVSAQHPDWRLMILGEGPRRSDLENQVRSSGLSSRVSLPGTVADPFCVLRQADLFVLSSRFEGFPNALCEAMACGLPVVSFDCPSGPAEVIRDGIDGVLVPPENVDALACVLDRLMTNSAERARLAKRAPEVLDRFGVEKVMALWDGLLRAVISDRRR